MTSITLSCNIQRIFNQIPRIILIEIRHKIYEVISSLIRIINNFVSVINWKADSNRLIDTHYMSKMIPWPCTQNWFINPSFIILLNKYWSNLIKTSKLTRCSWSSLEPNNQRNTMISPTIRYTLPHRIIHRRRFISIIPVNIFIPWPWLLS